MVIGPYTVRRTADIEAEQAERDEEQAKRDRAKAVSAKLVETLLHTHRRDRAILRRWGLSEGLIEQEATYSGGEALSPPRGRP